VSDQLGGAGTPSGGDSRTLDVRYDIERNAISTVGTLGAVNYIVGALREVPGRKSIVLFSDGMQLFESPCGAASAGESESLDDYANITAELRRLIDRANRSGTVIYTMHATGLADSATGCAGRAGPGSQRGIGDRGPERTDRKPVPAAGGMPPTTSCNPISRSSRTKPAGWPTTTATI
jgi:hypothetical protein